MIPVSYEAIAAKAEWEGGLVEALDWFQDNQVPLDLQMLWHQAVSLKDDLENVLTQIVEVLYQHGIEM